MATMNCLLIAITLSATWHVTAGVCEDAFSPAQCRDIIATNATWCHDDRHFSSRYCKRSCGLCPLTCYVCNATSLEAARQCDETQLCHEGFKCLTMRKLSSKDGHHEYVLTCGSPQTCDGYGVHIVGRGAMSSKRDIHLTCCKDDLCNRPDTLQDPQGNATERTPLVVTPTHMTTQTNTPVMTSSTTVMTSTTAPQTTTKTLATTTKPLATTAKPLTTTSKPITLTTTINPLLQQFCEVKDSIECSDLETGTTVCGTDGITYASRCALDKVICENPAIHVGVC